MDFDDEDLESLKQGGEELDEEEKLLDKVLEETKNAADIHINTAANATVTNSQNEDVSKKTKHAKLTDIPIKKGKAIVKKGLKEFLKKYGSIIVAVGLLIFAFLIGILSFQMDFDLSGIGKPRPTYYEDTPSCGKVYLTWEKDSYKKTHEKDTDYEEVTDPALVDLHDKDRYDYDEYEYDEYIAGIIWTDNYNYKDVDNEIVYEAMGVIARSRLIANLPDNCVVLKYHNEQAKSFKELDGTEEKYVEINQAVRNTQGMIMTRNNKAIAAKYEPFSYTSKKNIEDESKNRLYYYHMAHKNKEETQRIPAKWVDDLEKAKGEKIPKEKKNNVQYLSSFSLYGARYNIEKENAEYNLYRILNYYFGYDIEFKTIDATANFGNDNLLAFGGSGCMWWPIGSDSTTIENGITFAGQVPASVRITSGFGNRGEVEGVENATTDHKAIDIGGPYRGYPEGVINIIAAADGKVIKTTSGDSLGNGIYIEHSGGIVTRYGHLHSVFVSPGTEVKQGQVIGKMGNTGASSGTHLDFQVQVNGKAVNPLNYVSPSNPRPTNCGLNVPIVTPSGSGSGKESVCVGFLNAGYSPAQTAGIMINVNGESGFNPAAYNPAGGGIGAYGLFQWRGDRQRALKSLNDFTKPEVQVAFALSELNGSESNAKTHVRSSSSAVEASYNFCVYYERPGTNMAEIQKACQGRKNETLANEFLTYVNNGCK